jgi:transposase
VVEVNARVGTRSEYFIEFLIGVMDTLNHFDMKRHYLVMDNAAIHKATEVKDLIASRGYKAIYLPSYSLFLNPIKLFWSKVKGGIRRDCLNANDSLSTRIIESAKTVSVDDCVN